VVDELRNVLVFLKTTFGSSSNGVLLCSNPFIH
jgi:hypothetical protein